MEDVSTTIDLFLNHQWIPAAAATIFLLVRIFKSSKMIWPITEIPPKLRTLIVVVLGFAGAALQAISTGVPWEKAVAENLIACLLAILAHDVLIEHIRKGRELFKPKEDEG